MVFLATAMSAIMAMLTVFSTVLVLAMSVLVGSLITYGTAFISFLIIIFS
jgi:hypothetical protein